MNSHIIENNWKNGWVLAICTCDRPLLLSRLLASISPYLVDLVVQPYLLVIDDSRDPKTVLLNDARTQKFCEENSLRYEYWNRQKRTDFCSKLANELPDYKKSILYLLSPSAHHPELISTGQVRNFAILNAMEKPMLMLDDDCLIEPLEVVDYDKEVRQRYTGRRAIIKTSFDELTDKLVNSTVNPFIEHLEVLAGGALSVNSIAGAFPARSMEWVYCLQNKEDVVNAANFLDNLDNDAALEIDQISWNGRPHNIMDKRTPFICTTLCGIPPLPLIPPMPPIDRNQDQVLGASILFLYEECQVYKFGWGLPHLPEPKRSWLPMRDQPASTYNNASFYLILMHQLKAEIPFNYAEDKLQYLAMSLSQLGEQDDLKTKIKETIQFQYTSLIDLIKKSASNAKGYDRYVNDCKRMIQVQEAQIKQIDSQLKEREKDLKDFAYSFSEALSDWPTIWAHCHKP